MPAVAPDRRATSTASALSPAGTGTPAVRLERWPALDGFAPMDAAEALSDLPGLALLETARPGRRDRWTFLAADPVAVLTEPASGPDPFAVARSLLGRLAAGRILRDSRSPGGDRGFAAVQLPAVDERDLPPFLGGLVGYLGYDLGGHLERLPHRVPDDQDLPLLRLGLYDRVVAWDRRTGRAWLGGRAVDGDAAGLGRRLDDLRSVLEERLLSPVPAVPAGPLAELEFTPSLDRPAYLRGVAAVRAAIARGDIYQANLTRRLSAPFCGDPWPLYRRLRTGDPALFAAYLDLGRPDEDGSVGTPAGGGPRAILSASPEPFLSATADGVVTTDPIKGTRPRGRDRATDRALAAELLASAKDRAENVMIVDVLRNDLGRVCVPGSVRVPRLCRLERTAAVQHLVSTVSGRLAPGRDAFDLLAASFPGGSITGAPKLRAIEILEDLEPVRRGPYTGTLGWLGPDGSMGMSILIRTFVADGRQLTLHVGGGITWRSDAAEEWDETVAKARGPLDAIGGREVE
jgi:para-aminobenzoate synthetase component 1